MAALAREGGLVFVDCHCHLTSERFDRDLDAVMERAERAGVRGLFVCSASQTDMVQVIQLRQLYPDRVFPCLGLHPLDNAFDADSWEATRNLIQAEHFERGIAAIGEIGLDFSRPILRERASAGGTSEQAVRSAQLQAFELQLALAHELGVPVNVHSRNAERQTLEILARSGARGVMHAFKGEAHLAAAAAKAGRLFFSFPPSLVYKREYQEAAKALPADALLLETDSPSLAAGGPRERNEPGRIGIVAAKLAELKGMSLEEVAHVTTRNALKLFGPTALGLAERIESFGSAISSDRKATRWKKDTAAATAMVGRGGLAAEKCLPARAALGAREVGHGGESAPEPPPPPEPGPADMQPAERGPSDRRRGRWRARADGGQPVADPTLCSAAFGSAFCD